MVPIIGITANQDDTHHKVAVSYVNAVKEAGGIPIILPPIAGLESQFVSMCDGFVFTGGDDPIMEHWGIPTHPKATPVSQERQSFELALLEALQYKPECAILGVCLGMQWMGLIAGGKLNQDLEAPHASHHVKGEHQIEGEFGSGLVHSSHHQALTDVGNLTVIARSDDGLIEAVKDCSRSWYVGVQWHPERTEHTLLGQHLFNQLVQASTPARLTSS